MTHPKTVAGACPGSGTPAGECSTAEVSLEGTRWIDCPICDYIGNIKDGQLERHDRYMAEWDEDDREAIMPGDYHYYNPR